MIRMLVGGNEEDLGSVGFLLIPGYSMLAFCSALETLRLTNQLLGRRYYTWRVYTGDGHPARASCGMTVAADSKPDDARLAVLFVIAGFDPWPQQDRRLRVWLRALHRRGTVLGAVDTGAFLLAAAELLENVPAVVHWESAAAFKELFPAVPVSDKLYEITGKRYLCAGGAAVLDMMIALLEKTHGSHLAAAIAERLIYRHGCSSDQEQRPVLSDRFRTSDPDVLRAIAVMEDRIETTASVGQIAAAANVSKRTLERKFQRCFDMTPKQVYLQCRLNHARKLLRHSDMSVRETAIACGFSSISYFCRAYKQGFQIKPGQDRRLDYSLVEVHVGHAPTVRMN